MLSIWIHLNNGTTKNVVILPSNIDNNGLLPELSKNLSTIRMNLLYNKQINGYQGFLFSLEDYTNIARIESRYYFAWIMNIIPRYDLGKTSQDKKILSSTAPYIDPTGLEPYIDLIGLETCSGGTLMRNKVCTKTICPSFNGGINRITVLSDILATY